MSVIGVPVWDDNVETGYRRALAEQEPVFVPTKHFADDRGWSLMNQMQNVLSPKGQINFSTQYPGVIKAWHRHKKQTDFWLVLRGHLKIGVHRQTDGVSWACVAGEKRPGTVIIPPTLWHGAATVGNEPAGLLYYVTEAYDSNNPDEERKSHDGIEGFPWEVQHG